jgi:NOL1/NOP2/fmu family ribosome biogenesis protein
MKNKPQKKKPLDKQLRILNTREIKNILNKLNEQHGIDMKLDYAFLLDQKNKIWLAGRGIDLVDFDQLRINTMGLYFGELNKHGQLRLSMEGAQLVGECATKNILALGREQVRLYFKGEELPVTCENGFMLLKYNNDFFGSALAKNKLLLNYLPRIHRTMELLL